MRVDKIIAQNSVQSLVFEKLDILRLLFLVRNVVNGLWLCICGGRVLTFVLFFVVQKLFKVQKLAVQVLINYNILYFIVKIVVFYAAEFYEVCDVFPAGFELFPVGFKQRIELVGNFFCDMLAYFCELDCRFAESFGKTFKGISGQSITPFKSIRYSGMTSFILSAINT